MKTDTFGVLQRVGRSFMLPIALLPVAGLLLGIGSSFTNPTTLETYGLSKIIYEGGVFYTILDIIPSKIQPVHQQNGQSYLCNMQQTADRVHGLHLPISPFDGKIFIYTQFSHHYI